MANVKIKAPVGYHFMVKSTDSKDFYLMRTASTGYKKHNADGYSSALSVNIELKGSHIVSTTTQRTATATTSSGRTATTRTTTPTRATRVNYSGGSSCGSGGGGY